MISTLVVGSGIWMAITTTLGLAAAFAGVYSPIPIAALGLLGTAILARGTQLRVLLDRGDDLWDWFALAMTAGVGAWTLKNLGQHIIVERDGGSYITTARWLARSGSLRPDVVDTSIFGPVQDLTLASPAVYSVGDGHVEFQFNHGVSTIQAIGFELFGARGLFAAATGAGLLALLALYLVMRELRVHPAIALAATAGLAISLPMQFIMRDGYSETFVMQAIWIAALLAGRTGHIITRTGARPWIVVGIVTGAITCYRADGLLYVIAMGAVLAVFAARSWVTSGDVARFGLGAAVPIAVGMSDFWFFSGGYAQLIGREAGLLAIGVVGIAVIASLIAAPPARRRLQHSAVSLVSGRAARMPRMLGFVGGTSIAAVLVFATVGRPMVQTQRRPAETADPAVARVVGQLQEIQGLPIDPTRMYAELSLRQLTWYLGWGAILLGCVGIGLIFARATTSRDRMATVFTCLVLVGAPLYILNPRITPDQVWATRRLVPLVLAALVVAAAYCLDAFTQWLRDRFTCASRPLPFAGMLAATVAVLVVPSAMTTWPVRRHADFRGMHPVMATICSYVGDDAATLSITSPNLDMALRSWCGTDSASAVGGGTGPAMAFFVDPGRTDCRSRFLITLGDAEAPGRANVVDSRRFSGEFNLISDRRLIGAPETYWTQRFDATFHRLEEPSSCG